MAQPEVGAGIGRHGRVVVRDGLAGVSSDQGYRVVPKGSVTGVPEKGVLSKFEGADAVPCRGEVILKSRTVGIVEGRDSAFGSAVGQVQRSAVVRDGHPDIGDVRRREHRELLLWVPHG